MGERQPKGQRSTHHAHEKDRFQQGSYLLSIRNKKNVSSLSQPGKLTGVYTAPEWPRRLQD
jgi:hypothetical protein